MAKILDPCCDFNPRSLAGATVPLRQHFEQFCISIHAPSRERHLTVPLSIRQHLIFQSTLPRGSDALRYDILRVLVKISIHAPSRERHNNPANLVSFIQFQSTLPRGSDAI